MENQSWFQPKQTMFLFVVVVIGLIAGYMFYANKKMIASGAYYKLEKKAKKSKENWYPD